MAVYYVYSGAAGTATGADWTNAKLTLAAGIALTAVGDTVYVAHDHSETAASTYTLNAANGSVANPIKIICVNRSGSVPPVSADRRTTAQVVNSGNNLFNLWGWAHYDGIILIAGNSTGAAALTLSGADNNYTRLDNCSLRLGSTGASVLRIGANGNAGSLIELNNTVISFSAVSQFVEVGAILRWRNTPLALIGTAVPTTLFVARSYSGGAVECIGVDLSAAGSGKTLVGVSASTIAQAYKFIDCKMDAAVTKSAAPNTPGSTEIDIIRSGAGAINYRVFRHRMFGTLEQETTIVRTGGASDGTTPISWKVITTANCGYSSSFECPPIAIWNDTSGSARTATVEGIWGGGAVPNDDDVWLDVEYLSSSSAPQGAFVNDAKADLLTAAAGQTSSTATWGGSTTKFKLAATFTPQQKGWIYARVRCAKASSTFYIDPLVTLT